MASTRHPIQTHLQSVAHVSTPMIPPLEGGDRLTRHEFERRYHAMPHIKKAELLEGVVYMPSPTRFKSHATPHSALNTVMGVYAALTPGVEVADNATIRLDPDNEVQPDVLLRITFEHGGRSHVTPDDYLEGAPELIIEIAASSASYDLHDKLKVYRRHEVYEYLVWRVLDRACDWFKLEEGQYLPVSPDSEGIIRSDIFPGLYLAVPALLEGDMARVLEVLHQGLATSEHQTFFERLANHINQTK